MAVSFGPRNPFSTVVVLLVTSTILGLVGCSTVSSRAVDKDTPADGLAYFLPRRDIVISVIVPQKTDDAALEVNAEQSEAMPDLTAAYVATVPRSQIAKINTSLQVNAKGLLNSDSSGASTSDLTAIFQGLAGLPGAARAFKLDTGGIGAAEVPCSQGTHTRVVSINAAGNGWGDPVASSTLEFCGVQFMLLVPGAATLAGSATQSNVTTRRASQQPGGVPDDTAAASAPGEAKPGLFYRVSRPYIVRTMLKNANAKTDSRDFLVFSPSGSPTYFLPAARAGFGNNTVSFSFTDGVPTKYGQSIDSEVLGVVQLPATILKAYFAAIGEMFTARKTPAESEKAYLEAVNALAVAQQKRTECFAAIATDDSVKIKEACSQ